MSAPVRWVHTAALQRVVFGPQALDGVPRLVRDTGARRVLVVTSPGAADTEAGRHLIERLGRACATVFESDTTSASFDFGRRARANGPTPAGSAEVRAMS